MSSESTSQRYRDIATVIAQEMCCMTFDKYQKCMIAKFYNEYDTPLR